VAARAAVVVGASRSRSCAGPSLLPLSTEKRNRNRGSHGGMLGAEQSLILMKMGVDETPLPLRTENDENAD
jgi:hypothetical protein